MLIALQLNHQSLVIVPIAGTRPPATAADGARMESKRQRLGEGGAAPDDSSQLAHVLSKLTALVTQGAGDAEGLDDLLEQLGRLQAKLNGASEPAFKAIEDAQARLQVQPPRSQGRRRPAAAATRQPLPPRMACVLLHCSD